MGRYSLRQLCTFVVACGAYFGGIPHMFLLGLRGAGTDNLVAFATEAVLAWSLIAAVYVYWRQWTPLAVHCLCVALSLPMLLGQADVRVQMEHVALATIGRGCWAATLISFPVSLGLLALSAVMGRRVEPLSRRLNRDAVGWRDFSVPRSPDGAADAYPRTSQRCQEPFSVLEHAEVDGERRTGDQESANQVWPMAITCNCVSSPEYRNTIAK